MPPSAAAGGALLVQGQTRRWPLALWSLACASVIVLSITAAHGTSGWAVDDAARGLLSPASDHPIIRLFVALAGHPALGVGSALTLAGLCAVRSWWRGFALAVTAPLLTALLVELVLKPLVSRSHTGHLSFPSGTAAFAFVVACVVLLLLQAPSVAQRWSRRLRACCGAAALVPAAGIAAAVVADDWHYATDVVGGLAVAGAVTLGVAMLVDRTATTLGGRVSVPRRHILRHQAPP